MKYYDGGGLLSQVDINGNKPEIYISTSNRSAGKTTYFNRLCIKRYLKNGDKFCILYRYKYEVEDAAKKFFPEIQRLFYPEHNMTQKNHNSGVYCDLILDNKIAGYATSLSGADGVKKLSHIFSEVKLILFDEFQNEQNTYLDHEVEKLLSIHTSMARGGGEQVRYLPIIMISNYVSLLNPYYVSLGISEKLNDKTKFLKGDGFVVEQGFNEPAAIGQEQSLFNRAFSAEKYTKFAASKIYLNDNASMIEKYNGRMTYKCNILVEGRKYAIKQAPDFIYVDDRIDDSFPKTICASTDDMDIDNVMLTGNSIFIHRLRQIFNFGGFRFRNLACKHALLVLLSY